VYNSYEVTRRAAVGGQDRRQRLLLRREQHRQDRPHRRHQLHAVAPVAAEPDHPERSEDSPHFVSYSHCCSRCTARRISPHKPPGFRPHPPRGRPLQPPAHPARALHERYTGVAWTALESGTLTLKKPGLIPGATTRPSAKLFVLDGSTPGSTRHGTRRFSPRPAQAVGRTCDRRCAFCWATPSSAKELDQIATVPIRIHAAANFKITGGAQSMAQRDHLLTLTSTPSGAIERHELEETDGPPPSSPSAGSKKTLRCRPA